MPPVSVIAAADDMRRYGTDFLSAAKAAGGIVLYFSFHAETMFHFCPLRFAAAAG
ncbi:MAG: hypothetical protein Q4A62_06115 [Eikenella sp.]|nr:hypothetical protein [Eikenella sp.]